LLGRVVGRPARLCDAPPAAAPRAAS